MTALRSDASEFDASEEARQRIAVWGEGLSEQAHALAVSWGELQRWSLSLEEPFVRKDPDGNFYYVGHADELIDALKRERDEARGAVDRARAAVPSSYLISQAEATQDLRAKLAEAGAAIEKLTSRLGKHGAKIGRLRVEAQEMGRDVETSAANSERARVRFGEIIAGLEQERDEAEARVKEELDALRALFDAVEKDECSTTYCAQGRGGMVHTAWLAVHAIRAGKGEEAGDGN